MIDLSRLRKSPADTIAALAKKDPSYDGWGLYECDKQVSILRNEIENLRAQKNNLARQAQGGPTGDVRQESLRISELLKENEAQFNYHEKKFKDLYLSAPNIPDITVPEGYKEANVVTTVYGDKPTFSFPIKNHVELGNALGWFNFDIAARMAGSNFVLYKKEAVSLLYALVALMLKTNSKYGYEPVVPPTLVNAHALEIASNFPRFKDQVYAIPEDNLYLTPTSEVNLTNMYANHIFNAEDLPVRLTAWTSCFRREAGGYGATERGLIRIHQFEKVELYTFCSPDKWADEQDRMIACCEDILKQLGLSYRICLLAAQDCSFASAKTYDIEVWAPGQEAYLETSSCSWCSDFQARRGLIRWRKSPDSKPELVHTLNGSSLALPRIMVALMEMYQQPDGSICLPNSIKKMDFLNE